MNRKHIHFLQSIDPLYGGGLISSCIELASAQKELGESVQILSTTTSSMNSLRLDGFIQLALCRWPKAFLYAPKLMAGLKELPENGILHNHGLYMYTSYLATKLKQKKHYTMVQHVHGMFEPWVLSRSKWKKAVVNILFENYKYQNAEYWRALTPREANQIRTFGISGKVVLAPNGIDLKPIDSYLQVEPKIKRNKRRIGFLGRLHEKKGVKPFVEAFSQVNDNIKQDWELVIAGPDEGVMKAILPYIDTSRGLKWVGEVRGKEKYDFLNSIDLFVLPSFSEGFSMAILEACAFGVPVLITDQCNFDEAYQYGAMRLNDNRSTWKSDLEEVLQISVSELNERGKSLRKLVENKYVWEKIAQDINDQICK